MINIIFELEVDHCKNPKELNNLLEEKKPMKFLVVRHPFHRLISAYRDKFEKKHVSSLKYSLTLNISKYLPFLQRWFYMQYAKQILPDYKMQSPIKRVITFQEFVRWVISTNPDDMDV